MATIIWCDRAKYVVAEPRTEVQRRMAAIVGNGEHDPRRGDFLAGFVYFTRGSETGDDWASDSGRSIDDGQSVCLSIAHISAFEAVPGHGI